MVTNRDAVALSVSSDVIGAERDRRRRSVTSFITKHLRVLSLDHTLVNVHTCYG